MSCVPFHRTYSHIASKRSAASGRKNAWLAGRRYFNSGTRTVLRCPGRLPIWNLFCLLSGRRCSYLSVPLHPDPPWLSRCQPIVAKSTNVRSQLVEVEGILRGGGGGCRFAHQSAGFPPSQMSEHQPGMFFLLCWFPTLLRPL